MQVWCDWQVTLLSTPERIIGAGSHDNELYKSTFTLHTDIVNTG